jgi:two-component system, OmpR family, phosphate regulon sensor histidine kinase PhoR
LLRYSNWRLTLLYGVIFIATIAALGLYMRITGCADTQSCVQSGILIIVAGGLTLIVGISLWVSAKNNSDLRELADMARRIAGGEFDARILPRSNGEEAELTRAVNDMADRLRNEMRLFAKENQQFSIVFENMADGALITDALGRVLFINPAAAKMLNFDMDRAYGRSIAEVVRHHQLIELWQDCRSGGREAVSAVEIGRNLFLQAFVTPFEERGTRGFLVILQDLTQVRFLQTVRRDFISNISHELRTPLASIRAIVETLQDGALEEKDLAERFLSRAEGELDTMTQMVEELLELARIESGEVPLRLVDTNVREMVQIPLERIQQQAARENLTIVVDIPEDLPLVLADAERMYRVVSNLLHNAIKFTSAGGTIRIAAYMDGDPASEVVVLVHDTGIGIADEDIDRIFERFYKSDRARTRSQGGTGLGLAIAKHLVEAHGGRIWVKSRVGKGSTFYFSIPTVKTAVN